MKRGEIRNREYALRLNDFSGLLFGTITPTDIDGFIDFGGKAFVVFEIKKEGTAVPHGQKLAIERMVDACAAGGVCAVGMIAFHDTDVGDVDAASCRVTLIRQNGRWMPPRHARTLREAIDILRRAKEV